MFHKVLKNNAGVLPKKEKNSSYKIISQCVLHTLSRRHHLHHLKHYSPLKPSAFLLIFLNDTLSLAKIYYPTRKMNKTHNPHKLK